MLYAGLRLIFQDVNDAGSLMQFTVDDDAETTALMDMLLVKKRASDRKAWPEKRGV